MQLQAALWLEIDGQSLGGPDRMALLSAVARQGSITHGARAVGVSYKTAWDAIDAMNNLAGEPLVERVSGGRGGGGTRLTPRGERLVANFRLIEREHRRFIETLDVQAAGLADDYLLIRRMLMRTSARNQFIGKVARVQRGAVNDEVELEVAGGQRIVAVITHESSADLGLKPGVEAFALIKASSIVLVTGADQARFSARNRLTGTISRVSPGAVNTEVVIELAGGGSVAAIVTNESRDALGLEAGQSATAVFKASSVIIGVPA